MYPSKGVVFQMQSQNNELSPNQQPSAVSRLKKIFLLRTGRPISAKPWISWYSDKIASYRPTLGKFCKKASYLAVALKVEIGKTYKKSNGSYISFQVGATCQLKCWQECIVTGWQIIHMSFSDGSITSETYFLLNLKNKQWPIKQLIPLREKK